MRYAKGSLVISEERDIPLLRQVRNSRFVSHDQLFELMKFGGSDRSRDSFNWRVRRLVKSGHLHLCRDVFWGRFGGISDRSRRDRPARTSRPVHHCPALQYRTSSACFAGVSFARIERIQLALAQENLLASWQSEVEIASFNTISRSPYRKDYDAIVDVWVGDKTARFALEYERTLKSYRAIRTHAGRASG